MGISAIAFIPVGYMAAKIGRRKSIIIGFGMAVVSFVLIFAFVRPNNEAIIPAVLFALFYLIAGFGLIIANVNTFPMVTELSTSATVGQYTGYYYMATMSAQAITPFIAGLIMDHISNRGLFVYSAICVAIAIVLMIFVKHGDSVAIGKGRKLTKEEKKQIRLDALDAD
jgi:MFS family permease